MMNPATRTKNLMKLLGWQCGTIHDACKEIGCDPHEFLYADSNFTDDGPNHDFRRGYADAEDIAIYISKNKGNLQYWFGAISEVQNELIVGAESKNGSDGRKDGA
jgi:hypothetical protein